jgi:hypothetical protein
MYNTKGLWNPLILSYRERREGKNISGCYCWSKVGGIEQYRSVPRGRLEFSKALNITGIKVLTNEWKEFAIQGTPLRSSLK